MTRTVERCLTEIAAKQQSKACGCLETLAQVILVNQMQSLLVSWRCKRFVNYCRLIAHRQPAAARPWRIFRRVERCRTEIAAKQQSMACGCLETLAQVILVNQMQSLLVSWRCKRFVNYRRLIDKPLHLH